MTRNRVPRPAAALMLGLLIALMTTACAAGAAAPQGVDEGAPLPASSAGGGGTASDEEAPGQGQRGLAAPIEQRIIKTGEISLEVTGVPETVARVRALALELGGYVGGSQAGTRDESATLILRLPAPRFDEALARLHQLDGEVIAEGTREEDVTGQIVDLEARIANLRASEASYRELVARAERIDDVLAVQARLDQVRGEIEQLAAQLEQVSERAALSTLTVTVIPRAQPVQVQAEAWDPGAQFNQALAALVGIGQGIADIVIWFVIVWLPVLLVLSLLVLLTLRGVLEARRRLPLARIDQPPAA